MVVSKRNVLFKRLMFSFHVTVFAILGRPRKVGFMVRINGLFHPDIQYGPIYK